MTPADPWKWETHYHVPAEIEESAKAQLSRQVDDLNARLQEMRRPPQVKLVRAEELMDG